MGASFGGLLLLLSSCDRGEDDSTPPDLVPVRLGEVWVTTGADSEGNPIHESIAADGSTEVLSTTSVRLKFDRFLLPNDATTRQSICLQPSLKEVKSYVDCTLGEFLEPTYNPVGRELIFRQQPGARLARGTHYRLTVLAPTDAFAPTGIRAFDRAPLEKTLVFDFATVAVDPDNVAEETAPSSDLYCEDGDCRTACGVSPTVAECRMACFDDACKAACLSECVANCPGGAFAQLKGCASAGCHADVQVDATLHLAAMGLDLGSAAGLERTAIGHVAHQTQTGEHADEQELSSSRFGRSMPLIDPGNPGNSYLIYKLLIGPGAQGDAKASIEEINRLTQSVVVGLGMPAFGGAIDEKGISVLSNWIARGANTKACN